jgi:hypothetical protein
MPKLEPQQCRAGCGRMAKVPWSYYCHMHATRLVRHGAPNASLIKADQLARYRETVRAAIHRNSETPAVQGALRLAQQLLDYRPSHQFSFQLTLRRRMQILVGANVSPEDVVCRVAEFVFYENDNPFKYARERDMQLARVVFKLAPMSKWVPTAHASRLLAGLIIEDGLWRFAAGLRLKLERDHDERVKLLKGLDDYTLGK